MNFNQLKQKQNENVGLVNIIKTKERLSKDIVHNISHKYIYE